MMRGRVTRRDSGCSVGFGEVHHESCVRAIEALPCTLLTGMAIVEDEVGLINNSGAAADRM